MQPFYLFRQKKSRTFEQLLNNLFNSLNLILILFSFFFLKKKEYQKIRIIHDVRLCVKYRNRRSLNEWNGEGRRRRKLIFDFVRLLSKSHSALLSIINQFKRFSHPVSNNINITKNIQVQWKGFLYISPFVIKQCMMMILLLLYNTCCGTIEKKKDPVTQWT